MNTLKLPEPLAVAVKKQQDFNHSLPPEKWLAAVLASLGLMTMVNYKNGKTGKRGPIRSAINAFLLTQLVGSVITVQEQIELAKIQLAKREMEQRAAAGMN